MEKGIHRAIHEAAGAGVVSDCQKLTVCKTGECKLKLGYKLFAKYVFFTINWMIFIEVVYRIFLLTM